MQIAAKNLWTKDGFLENAVITIENGIVTDVASGSVSGEMYAYVTPGFIDQHVHGGYGATVMHSSKEEILHWLDFLLRGGVTQILSGVYTASLSSMRKGLALAREVMQAQAQGAGGALLAGVHLEGPFISPNALGAMDVKSIMAPTIENYRKLTEGYEDIIRLVTVAPEVEGAETLIRYLCDKGIPVEAGHTAATDAEGRKAFADGISCITHFFNASPPIRHRAPGILTEALINDDVYCECICDFVHVHAPCVKLIHRCKGPEKMIVISDAVETTGLPDGEYTFGGSVSVVKNGESRTLEGNLNGGGMVPVQEIRNLRDAGIPLWDAFCMTSHTPAAYLGIPGGCVEAGSKAELVCLNEQLRPCRVICGTQDAAGNEI